MNTGADPETGSISHPILTLNLEEPESLDQLITSVSMFYTMIGGYTE